MSNTDSLNRKLETDFATLELDNNNIIHVTGKEGVDIKASSVNVLLALMIEIY